MTEREQSWPAEFELALQCCKSAFRSAAPRQLTVPEGTDWQRFFRYTAFHRVEGLGAAALTGARAEIPAHIRFALADRSGLIAARNLEVTAECQSLLETFEKAGVLVLFLKGLTVGALAYRNPMTKTAVDIDLLVDPKDLRSAARCLREANYRLVTPRGSSTDDLLRKWHRISKESVWFKQSSSIQLDLHTSASDNAWLIPQISVHSPRQVVDVGNGVHLPTFAIDELVAYLAVHGASSAWFRLKWISDFAGLLHGRGAEEIERIYERSQELCAGRAAGQASLLADRLFGTLEVNPELRRHLLADSPTCRLCSTALRLLIREPVEPTEQWLGTVPHRMSQFLLLPGTRFKLRELADQARRIVVNRLV